MNSGRKILVIAPHMDDEALGMGGTIARHVKNGDAVHVCFVAHRVYSKKYDEKINRKEMENALQAGNILGCAHTEFFNLDDERLDTAIQDILIPMEKFIDELNPDVVYSNFYGDNNQDHRAVFQAVRVAIRPFAKTKIPQWHLYETPSSTEQSPPVTGEVFMPNHYVNITETFKTKIDACHCYVNERRTFPHPRSEKAIEALAMKRGSEIGFKKAEAFMTMRSCWK